MADNQAGAATCISRVAAAKWRMFHVMSVVAPAFRGACRDEHVVSLSSDHSLLLLRAQRAPSLGCSQMYDRRLPPVRLQQLDGVLRSKAVGRGKPGEDGVRFRQRMSGEHKLFTGALASLEFHNGSRMVFVPGTDGRDEDAGVAEVSSHPAG